MWKKLSEIGVRGEMRRMMKMMTEGARSAMMLDGEISKCVDVVEGVPQRCTLSPNLFMLYIKTL